MPKCRYCEEKYEKTLPTQPDRVCLKPDCVVAYWTEHKEKCRTKAKKEQRRETRRMREKAKTYSDLVKEAQHEFNRFIRFRDHGRPCISCGRHHEGQYHAGHYISVGSARELRFSEDNCHLQCAPCNNHKSGNIIEYRKYLIKKVGLRRVEWLEGPHQIQNWTHEDLREIKLYYRDKWKQLEKKKE